MKIRISIEIKNMKAVIQRVSSAQVKVDGEVISSIGKGLMVLVGIHRTDTRKELE